jgi:Arc/MetJ family transcription regulator
MITSYTLGYSFMRTNVELDDVLVKKAMKKTKIPTKKL